MDQVAKKRLRFTDHDDITLLREVLGQNPIEHPSLWIVVQENMLSVTKKNFSIRTLKEHLELLIKLWLKELKMLKGLSGIEVSCTEKESLCESIYGLMCEQEKEKKVKKSLNISKELGLQARNRCASTSSTTWSGFDEVEPTFNHSSTVEAPLNIGREEEISIEGDHSYYISSDHCVKDIENGKNLSSKKETSTTASSSNTPRPSKVLGPIRSRKRKINTQRQGLAYLEAYDSEQNKLKKKELELEERRLALEERKVAIMEKQTAISEFQIKKNFELAEKTLQLETDQRKELTDIIKRQDMLINYIISKNNT